MGGGGRTKCLPYMYQKVSLTPCSEMRVAIVLLVAAAGDVFFHEAAYYTHAQWLAVLAGTGLVVVGVAAIGYTNAERELQRQEEERREGSALSGQHGKDLRGAGGVAALM